MTRYIGPKDGNKDGEQSFIQLVNALFNAEVATGLNVSQQSTPAMGVSVNPGTAAIQTGNGYPYTIWSTAIENVTLNTADGSNPRIDLIVAYVDLSITNTSSSNSPGGWSLIKVTGTPSGSPVVPNAAAIQAALPNSSYPYIILAQVAVATAATTITNANITDVRNLANLTNISAAWQSWTPSYTNVTIGNATNNGNFLQVGKKVTATASFKVGSTTSLNGAISINLPVAPNSRYSSGVRLLLGYGTLLKSGSAVYPLTLDDSPGISTCTLRYHAVSGSNIVLGTVTPGSPINFAANDGWELTLIYEAAR